MAFDAFALVLAMLALGYAFQRLRVLPADAGRTLNLVVLYVCLPAAVLRYLAVAHYGRGRGEWVASEYPPFWRDAVVHAIERSGGVASVVALRAAENCNVASLATAWQRKLREITLAVLAQLYPEAAPAAARSMDNKP